MRKKRPFLWMLAVAIVGAVACENVEEPGKNKVLVLVDVGIDQSLRVKSGGTVDVSDYVFILRDVEKKLIDSTTVSAISGGLELVQGKYYMEVYSHKFEKPEFDRPYYYASSMVNVTEAESMVVSLICTLANVGIQVDFSDDFVQVYETEDYYLAIKDNSLDSLVYNVDTEDKWGYFAAGQVQMILYINGEMRSTLLQTFDERTKISVNITPETIIIVPVTADISVDENSESLTVSWKVTEEEQNNGLTKSAALTVTEFKQYNNLLDGSLVWVKGYVVSGKVSAGKVYFSLIEAGDSHIAIADNPSVSDSESCIAIELPSSSEWLREMLSLQRNPNLAGTMVWVLGTVASNYLGIQGMKDPVKASTSL